MPPRPMERMTSCRSRRCLRRAGAGGSAEEDMRIHRSRPFLCAMRPATGVLAQRHGDDLKAAWQVVQYSTKCKARRKVLVCHDGVMCVVRGLRVLHKAHNTFIAVLSTGASGPFVSVPITYKCRCNRTSNGYAMARNRQAKPTWLRLVVDTER